VNGLTLHHHILAGLLVSLALTADLVSQPVALVVQCLAVLTYRVVPHQLALDTEDQYRDEKYQASLTPTKIFQPWHVAGIVAQTPLSRVCST